MTFEEIYKTFIVILNIADWEPPVAYKSEFSKIVNAIGSPKRVATEDFDNLVCNIICDKLSLTNDIEKEQINILGKNGIFLNYHEKSLYHQCLATRDIFKLTSFLYQKDVPETIIQQINTISLHTNQEIHCILQDRLSKDDKWRDIIDSIFACLVYSLFNHTAIDKYYTGGDYLATRFYDYLKLKYPSKYDRGHALSMLHIDKTIFQSYGDYDSALSAILQYIAEEYTSLQNYCYTSVLIDNINIKDVSITWRLYSDIVLYACKFKEEFLKVGYFHPDKISTATRSYIPQIDSHNAQFEIANTGFTYKDCIIISNGKICREGECMNAPYSILLLFQKNMRDEDVIPCPACRSENVRGNSYPTLGVKSWECNNPLCPDKSKYNRGKRYSMSSIIKQEAIEDVRGVIEKSFLNEWRLDVVGNKTIANVIEYIVKEYSFVGDTVILTNIQTNKNTLCKRKLIHKEFNYESNKDILSFYNSAFFHRFAIKCHSSNNEKFTNISDIKGISIYNGNCYDVLSSIKEDSFDGAITSPPYYNAKSYSHWDNIYCYLYDMYNQASEVYRTLKNGAYYLYNIFDYFDNENNVVLSAMGQSRMILGAYIIYLFRKIGFEIQGNIIWFKGHIQGHRSTNQGNNSPYYQAPLNCYEHILCFRKLGDKSTYINFPTIVNIYPVVKMVKGENILGHSAPFPPAIPDILISRIKDGCILEPYAGSFTTARVAKKYSLPSVNIEMSREYCELGLKLIQNNENTLF